MRCPKCGTENPQGKIVCRKCGTRLRVLAHDQAIVRETDEQLMARVRLDAKRIVWVFAIIVPVTLLIGYLTR